MNFEEYRIKASVESNEGVKSGASSINNLKCPTFAHDCEEPRETQSSKKNSSKTNLPNNFNMTNNI
jgi:hypothetical protein